MTGKANQITLNPAVVRWSLESRGWETAELAEKSGVPEPVIKRIQSERAPIDTGDLKKISECMGHPLTAFLLPKPPEEPELVNYGRAGASAAKPSKGTLDAVRTSRYWQYAARRLLEEHSENLEPDASRYPVGSDPARAALVEARRLKFEPGSGRSPKRIYDMLRESIESLNIFVYQLEMDGGDAGGICLTAQLPATITVDLDDPYEQRIFSLLHGYAHVLLRTNGYCIPAPEIPGREGGKYGKIEGWCNSFAGSVMMPEREFLERASGLEGKPEDAECAVKKLSSHFAASREAVMSRIAETNPPSRPLGSRNGLPEHGQRTQKPKRRRHSGRTLTCLDKRGRRFVSLVLYSSKRNIITLADAMNYLALNPGDVMGNRP